MLYQFGKYLIMLRHIFTRPEKFSVFWKLVIYDIYDFGINSVAIVSFMSLFVGAVVTVQTAVYIDSPLLPKYLIGLVARDSIILEFAPTMIAIILAGKIGSNIASNIGTMKTTEQIDALRVMGVNPINYLMLPKVVAMVFFNPFLIAISMILGVIGGWVAGVSSGLCSSAEFMEGLTMDFSTFNVAYAFIKTILFSFVIATVSCFQGFYTKVGAVEVGRASTRAVVYCSVFIIILNYMCTQLLLT